MQLGMIGLGRMGANLVRRLTRDGHECVVYDLGTDSAMPRIDDRTKHGRLSCALTSGAVERGLLVCSSGVGAVIAACTIAGVRASVCHDVYTAHQGVEHDDMNVLSLGSEIVGGEAAAELVRAFLAATFDGDERYVRPLHVAEVERDGCVFRR
jgi:ribose 5-phosphate isomerase B